MGFDNDSSTFLNTYQHEPYSSSLESATTHASDSVWSAAASQSSNETSPSHSSSSDSDPCDSYILSRQTSLGDQPSKFTGAWAKKTIQPAHATLPSELRQNPRRSADNATRCPPALVRQCDRKVNFVDNLVGKKRPVNAGCVRAPNTKLYSRRLFNPDRRGHLALVFRCLPQRARQQGRPSPAHFHPGDAAPLADQLLHPSSCTVLPRAHQTARAQA